MSFEAVPKVELHTHLEGSAPPDLIRALAREKYVDLSGIFTDDGGYAYRDFCHFLEVYEAATSVLQSPADFARLTKAVLDHAADPGVTLETCPGSHVFLGVYPDLATHPIARLRDAGVKVTVTTDDPPFFRTDMVKDYNDLSRWFGWDAADFKALNLTAIDAAFCDNTTRARVRKILEAQDV